MSDNGLADYSPQALYDFLSKLTEKRKTEGRGRSEAAAYARWYCDTMRTKVKAELILRGLPTTRPGDTRVYGPGQATWQRAQTEAA